MMHAGCPGENTLVQYVERQLAPPAMGQVEQHLDQCNNCLAVVAQLARSLTQRETMGGAMTTGSMSGPGAFAATVVESTMQPLPASLSRFKPLQTLEQTQLLSVLVALDERLGRRVALTLAHPNAPAFVKTGVSTAGRLIARVVHPNVAKVLEGGESEGGTFVAAELPNGMILADWLAQPHAPAEVANVMAGTARGLLAAHQVGVAHGHFSTRSVAVGIDGVATVFSFGLGANPLDDQYAFATAFAPFAPPSMRQALGLAVAPHPNGRYPSMAELIAALESTNAAPKRSLLLPLLLAGGFALVAVIGVVGFFVIRNRSTPKPTPSDGADEVEATVDAQLEPLSFEVMKQRAKTAGWTISASADMGATKTVTGQFPGKERSPAMLSLYDGGQLSIWVAGQRNGGGVCKQGHKRALCATGPDSVTARNFMDDVLTARVAPVAPPPPPPSPGDTEIAALTEENVIERAARAKWVKTQRDTPTAPGFMLTFERTDKTGHHRGWVNVFDTKDERESKILVDSCTISHKTNSGLIFSSPKRVVCMHSPNLYPKDVNELADLIVHDKRK